MNQEGPGADLHRRTSTGSRVAALAAILIAFLAYRPDRALPFDILDFSEFLPLLRDTDSFVARTQRLVGYYASQGRANLIPYVLMSAKWELFGDWSPGWQWARFAVMTGVLLLAFRLLRRLGMAPAAAMLGSGVFLVAPAAARGWIRLTTAEPLGTLLLLALCNVVLPARLLWIERRRWVAAVALTAAILLTKEMLVVALLLPVSLMCLTDDEGRVAEPRLSRPAVRLAGAMAVLSVVCLVPMGALTVRASRGGDAFSSQFGGAARSPGDTAAAWLATLLPFDPARAVPPAALGAALAAYLFVLTCFWGVRLRYPSTTLRGELAWLGLALGFPLVGAMEYIPWPAYQTFYALPYLAGTALLLALGVSAVLRRRRGVLAATACGALFAAALADAQAQSARAAASQLVHRRLVERLNHVAGADSIVVASDRRVPQAWQGLGPTLHRYARAVGSHIAPTFDIACTGVDTAVARSKRTAFVFYGSLCPHAVDDDPIVERYRRFDAGRLRVVEDSVRVDVQLPEAGANGRP